MVVGDCERFFIGSLHFGGRITALRQTVYHLLHGFVLSLPSGYVCVHVLNKLSRLSRLHFVDRDVVPPSIDKLKIRQQDSDLEISVCKLSRREIIVSDVVCDGFLCVISCELIEVCREESRDTTYCCVYHLTHIVFNNNKQYLFNY